MTLARNVPISGEVRVLKYMRIQAGLSLKAAGRILNVSDGCISHIENGRMNLPPERIDAMVTGYGYTLAEFLTLSRLKKLPFDRRQECERLVATIPANRLEEAYRILKALQVGAGR